MRQLSTGDFNRLNNHVPDFVGGGPSDAPTGQFKRPFSIVMNTESHSEPGDHWVAMYVKPKTFIFLDSYGRSPSDISFPPKFRQTVKRLGKGRKLIYNKKLVQALTSNACGYHAIYLLDSLALNKPLKTIVKVFDANLASNDQFVLKYYKKNFM